MAARAPTYACDSAGCTKARVLSILYESAPIIASGSTLHRNPEPAPAQSLRCRLHLRALGRPGPLGLLCLSLDGPPGGPALPAGPQEQPLLLSSGYIGTLVLLVG